MNSYNPYLDPNSDIIKKVIKKYPNGISVKGLVCLVMIESSGNPKAISPGGGYIGLGQVGKSVFSEYGPKDGERLNPEDNLMCVANLAQCNTRVLRHVLGRSPTDAEIYLAHQQGANGSLKLIENPHVRAGDLVGDARIKGNGGDPNKPASIFTNMWIKKFADKEALNG